MYKGTSIDFRNGDGNQKAVLHLKIGRIVKSLRKKLSTTSNFTETNRVTSTRQHLQGYQHIDFLSPA